jgi:hypothetical protein
VNIFQNKTSNYRRKKEEEKQARENKRNCSALLIICQKKRGRGGGVKKRGVYIYAIHLIACHGTPPEDNTITLPLASTSLAAFE